QGRVQGGNGELVDPERSVPWVLLEPGDDGAPADHEAGLRTAEQLVAGERHQVDTGGHGLGHGRLVREAPGPKIDQRPRAEVFHHRDPALATELDEVAR